jgi:DNA-binding HxlR family transcriptional regulator
VYYDRPVVAAPAPTAASSTHQAPPLRGEPEGLAEALRLVGDRWSLAIVANLLAGGLRFGALQELLAGISPNVLSQRLRALQESGLLVAIPYSRRPARYLYELTSAGAELAGAVRLLQQWGARRGAGGAEPPRHDACETPLELRWYCPACDEALAEPVTGAEDELYFA